MLKVFILTEGGKNIGFGHITRCTALYQAFEEKGIIPKFIVNGDESVLDLLKDLNYRLLNWIDKKEELFDLVKGVDVAIIDSYLADKDIYKTISEYVKISVYLDDNKRLDYPKGIVVNGAIYAQELKYPAKKGLTYLLGSKYMPLRKEFWDVPEKEIKENIESVMITFGGDDMRNMTPKVLRLLQNNFPDLIKNVVIGKGFKNICEVEELKDNKTNLIYYPDAEKIKNVMLESDIAISAAGQTTYELARVGIPTIAISIAKNQLDNVKGWEKTGFIEYAGWWSDKDILNNIYNCLEKISSFQIRKEKNKKGILYIDGEGGSRIVESILEG
ncbi:MAG: UDP-2,4-diacetamido-2,4,6-trideoxy-beta-L-altropyranose hydrolase [Candidatus Methanofastidiosum sp.]|nr:UDP-2,4-diacetamido-2,4,6-trideoxy-beta-L-altropyranose hydrolase [Methanofastidiosum sp.]